VRGIKLRKGDEVVAMVIIKREGTLLAISENGYGKRSPIEDYPKHKRGSKGVITIQTSARNGNLISLLEVVDNDDLMIVTRAGMIIRQGVDKISVIGRNTKGVKLINLNDNDRVYDVTRISPEDESDDQEEIALDNLEDDESEIDIDIEMENENFDEESLPEDNDEENSDAEDETGNHKKDKKTRDAVQEEIEF
jgi:DNA gyrase subunit A